MNLSHQLLHQIADPTLTSNERAQLRCQFAKQLEEAGNYEAAREAMGELWRGAGHRSVLEGLDEETAAAVILRAGVLTGWIGSCKQIEGAQETAKNLINESIRLFESLRDTEKIAEARMELGYCYWREGAFNEARDMLREALSLLSGSCSEVKAVTLIRSAIVERAAKRFNDAYRILTEALPLVDTSDNEALKGRFHIQIATVLENLGRAENRRDYIDRALIEYTAASFHFQEAGHARYQAYVENNLGFLFSTINKFPEAHEHLDRAQALFTSLKDKTHLAQVDDTRAKVLIAEGHISEAEKLARAAVQTLEDSDRKSLLAEALTTSGIALARLRRYQQAHLTLQSAVEVAQNAGGSEDAGLTALVIIEELGEHLTADDLSLTYQCAVELLATSRNIDTHARLSACATRLLFLAGALATPPTWKNFSLKQALRRYEARIIERALRDASGVVTRASRLLGFKHHNSLINLLNSHHRELLSARTPIAPRKRSLIFVNGNKRVTRDLTILHVEDNKLVAGAVRDTKDGRLERTDVRGGNCCTRAAIKRGALRPVDFR
jgi:tetratricopeptide (TPR) repeat protein